MMSDRPRPPRAASQTARRAPLWAALAWCALQACSGASDVDTLDEGEDLPGGETTNTLLFGSNAFVPAAQNISRDDLRMFSTGNAFFNQQWTVAPSSNTSRDGLGPLFNARSCATCHFKDGRGRPPIDGETELSSMLLRISVPGSDRGDAPAPDPIYGDQLQPYGIDLVGGEGEPRLTSSSITGQFADGDTYELLAPEYSIEAPSHGPFAADLLISPRVAPAMIGMGLLEAIPESRLAELADPADSDGDGISGRINHVFDLAAGAMAAGRFGWKAEQPSVRQQTAAAFAGDLGITSSLFPAQNCTPGNLECQQAVGGGDPEISDDLFERVVRYSQLLAVPSRLYAADADVLRGKARFSELGCESCHTARHRTMDDAVLDEVQGQLIWPYTDLLLHDMGEALSDRRPSFEAEGNEWRTPPLWGIGHYVDVNGHELLLHDGRARGVAEAILWHGGEALAAQQAFIALPRADRLDLIAFVESL
jgi:CxxC motif-containing protein (DUF1111 family)